MREVINRQVIERQLHAKESRVLVGTSWVIGIPARS